MKVVGAWWWLERYFCGPCVFFPGFLASHSEVWWVWVNLAHVLGGLSLSALPFWCTVWPNIFSLCGGLIRLQGRRSFSLRSPRTLDIKHGLNSLKSAEPPAPSGIPPNHHVNPDAYNNNNRNSNSNSVQHQESILEQDHRILEQLLARSFDRRNQYRPAVGESRGGGRGGRGGRGSHG